MIKIGGAANENVLCLLNGGSGGEGEGGRRKGDGKVLKAGKNIRRDLAGIARFMNPFPRSTTSNFITST